jgi:hypothetical protein
VSFSDAMALPKIGVAVRVRPPDSRQTTRAQSAIKGQVSNGAREFNPAPSHSISRACQFGHYEFDSVHDENATQEDVYKETILPVVNTFLQVSRAADAPQLLCSSLPQPAVLCRALTARSWPMVAAKPGRASL